ncbi:MAG: hypothetical protein EHM72_03715, partial [Calditrichaeota bacterium]
MGARCFAAAVLLLVVGFNCAFEEPKAPSWQVSINIPITSQNISIQNLIEEDHALFSYGDGLLGLRVEGDLEPIQMGDALVLEDIEDNFQVDIPNVTMQRLNADLVKFPFSSVSGLSSVNGPQVVAPFSFQNVKGELKPEQDIESIKLNQGSARLVYKNKLPVDLNNVVFHLFDPGDNEFDLKSPIIQTIPAGKTDSLDLDISGKELSRWGEWYMTGSSPGSRGRTVAIDSSMKVALTVDFVNFRVTTVHGRNQSFYVEDHQEMPIDQQVSLEEAVFGKGFLSLDVTNDLDLDLDLAIDVNDIRLPAEDAPLTVNTRVAANSSRQVVVPLASHKMALDPSPGIQSLSLSITANGASRRDEMITINETDAIRMKMEIRDASLTYFRGSLDHYTVAFGPYHRTISLPQVDRFAGLNLSDGRLRLDLISSIDMPIWLDGFLHAENGQGRAVDVHMETQIETGSENQPVTSSFILQTPENPAILDLMNLPPKSIRIYGEAQVGDGIHSGIILPSSSLKTHYVLETPANLAWEESLLESDTLLIKIYPEDTSYSKNDEYAQLSANDTNHLLSFSLNTEIENHLPVGAVIEFCIVDAAAPESERLSLLAPIDILPALTDSRGRTKTPQKIVSRINFSEEQMAKLKNHGDQVRSISFIA